MLFIESPISSVEYPASKGARAGIRSGIIYSRKRPTDMTFEVIRPAPQGLNRRLT
jgi:hypothetical protein